MSERPNPSSLPPSIRPDPKSVEEIDEAWGDPEPVLSQAPLNITSGDLPAGSRTTRPGPEPELARPEPTPTQEPAPATASVASAPAEAAPASAVQVAPVPMAPPQRDVARPRVQDDDANSRPVDSLEPRELGAPEAKPQGSKRGWVYAAVGVAALAAIFVLQNRDAETVEPSSAARAEASAPPVATVATSESVPDPTVGRDEPSGDESAASPSADQEAEAEAEADTEASLEGEPGEEQAAEEEGAAKTGQADQAKEPPAEGAVQKVRLVVVPPDAEIYRKGKRIGKGEATVEIEPGERKAFEVYREGYVLRKVTLDGSESEVTVGLRPKSKSPAKR